MSLVGDERQNGACGQRERVRALVKLSSFRERKAHER